LRANKRRDFQRARLEPTADGELVVTVYPSRSSGVLSSVAWANRLVDIPAGNMPKQGDSVRFIPFSELLT
ncbi:MAG: molybdopterin molybdenumtransferase MoeA, partial [Pseudomonadota bacterium]|nr:molybdopterin molybdenumtransferase MoeA [Pseudomonadota bacterium]